MLIVATAAQEATHFEIRGNSRRNCAAELRCYPNQVMNYVSFGLKTPLGESECEGRIDLRAKFLAHVHIFVQ